MTMSTIISWCKSCLGLPPQSIHRVATALSAEVPGNDPQPEFSALELDEVNKVKKRLVHWAAHQNQINSQILNAFLSLEREGFVNITESELKQELPNIPTFEQNFNQMKTIAEHNHGKVFEVIDDQISIWRGVEEHVRAYEREVIGVSAYL